MNDITWLLPCDCYLPPIIYITLMIHSNSSNIIKIIISVGQLLYILPSSLYHSFHLFIFIFYCTFTFISTSLHSSVHLYLHQYSLPLNSTSFPSSGILAFINSFMCSSLNACLYLGSDQI